MNTMFGVGSHLQQLSRMRELKCWKNGAKHAGSSISQELSSFSSLNQGWPRNPAVFFSGNGVFAHVELSVGLHGSYKWGHRETIGSDHSVGRSLASRSCAGASAIGEKNSSG